MFLKPLTAKRYLWLRYRLAVLVWGMIVPSTSFSHTSLREGCRIRLAGELLNRLDDVELLKQHTRFRSLELKKAKSEIETIRTKLQDKKFKTVDTMPLDLGIEREAEALKSRLKILQTLMTEHTKKNNQDAVTIADKNKSLKDFKDSLLGIFVIQIKKSKNGYPYLLSYQNPCPEFERSCPLSDQEKKKMRQSFLNKTLPNECLRYLKQSL